MRGVRHVTRTGEMRNAYKTLVRKPEGERERPFEGIGVFGRIT
jgi:hypothetical protein